MYQQFFVSQEYLILCRSSIVLKRDTQGHELNRDNQSSLKGIYKAFNILFIAIYPITAGVCWNMYYADLVFFF